MLGSERALGSSFGDASACQNADLFVTCERPEILHVCELAAGLVVAIWGTQKCHKRVKVTQKPFLS